MRRGLGGIWIRLRLTGEGQRKWFGVIPRRDITYRWVRFLPALDAALVSEADCIFDLHQIIPKAIEDFATKIRIVCLSTEMCYHTGVGNNKKSAEKITIWQRVTEP